MSLYEAMNQTARTENGAAAYQSTLNANLDLFFHAGASRGQDISPLFARAYGEDENLAVRTLLWLRDVREGAGERQQFKNLVQFLIETQQNKAVMGIIDKIPELGRFDDLLVFYGTKYQKLAFKVIELHLMQDNGLCAKWMPRQGKVANALRKSMGIKLPKDYRKLLVNLTQVVEQQMCAQDWENIEYGKVPSVAAGRYAKAFGKHDPAGYEAYKEKLETGEEKINAGAVYPYDVVKGLHYGDNKIADAQWKALPNYMENNPENWLCMVDTSGSMGCSAGGSSSVTCKDVALSLGLYISERSEGLFKDQFLTFSGSPKLQVIKGKNLSERYHGMSRAQWDMNTNLQKAFEVILDAAVSNKIPADQMPSKLLILSDMQFDQCTNANQTLFNRARDQYERAGYQMPQIVFWNLHSTGDRNVPVTISEQGVALVSGFSPTMVKNLLGGELDPVKVMLKTLLVDRYNWVE